MPVTRPPAPIRAIAALLDELPAFLSGPNYGSAGNLVSQTSAGPALQLPSPAELGIPVGGAAVTAIPDLKPLQVFALGAKDVMAKAGLNAAVSAGWRFYIAVPRTHAFVMAWVSERQPGVWKMAAAFFGGGVADALNASLALDTLVGATTSYESRMLIVPAVNLEAFWLKSLTPGNADLLVPFPALNLQPIAGLNTQSFYPEGQFLAALMTDISRWQNVAPNSGG